MTNLSKAFNLRSEREVEQLIRLNLTSTIDCDLSFQVTSDWSREVNLVSETAIIFDGDNNGVAQMAKMINGINVVPRYNLAGYEEEISEAQKEIHALSEKIENEENHYKLHKLDSELGFSIQVQLTETDNCPYLYVLTSYCRHTTPPTGEEVSGELIIGLTELGKNEDYVMLNEEGDLDKTTVKFKGPSVLTEDALKHLVHTYLIKPCKLSFSNTKEDLNLNDFSHGTIDAMSHVDGRYVKLGTETDLVFIDFKLD